MVFSGIQWTRIHGRAAIEPGTMKHASVVPLLSSFGPRSEPRPAVNTVQVPPGKRRESVSVALYNGKSIHERAHLAAFLFGPVASEATTGSFELPYVLVPLSWQRPRPRSLRRFLARRLVSNFACIETNDQWYRAGFGGYCRILEPEHL